MQSGPERPFVEGVRANAAPRASEAPVHAVLFIVDFVIVFHSSGHAVGSCWPITPKCRSGVHLGGRILEAIPARRVAVGVSVFGAGAGAMQPTDQRPSGD